MFVFGIAALIPLVFSFQKASHTPLQLQMRNSHMLPIQAACPGKMINYRRRVLSYYDNKRLRKVYYY